MYACPARVEQEDAKTTALKIKVGSPIQMVVVLMANLVDKASTDEKDDG